MLYILIHPNPTLHNYFIILFFYFYSYITISHTLINKAGEKNGEERIDGAHE